MGPFKLYHVVPHHVGPDVGMYQWAPMGTLMVDSRQIYLLWDCPPLCSTSPCRLSHWDVPIMISHHVWAIKRPWISRFRPITDRPIGSPTFFPRAVFARKESASTPAEKAACPTPSLRSCDVSAGLHACAAAD